MSNFSMIGSTLLLLFYNRLLDECRIAPNMPYRTKFQKILDLKRVLWIQI